MPVDAVLRDGVNDDRKWLCDEKAICEYVHLSDNGETLCDVENSWLPVDVDNKETLCDDNSGLRACSHERK